MYSFGQIPLHTYELSGWSQTRKDQQKITDKKVPNQLEKNDHTFSWDLPNMVKNMIMEST